MVLLLAAAACTEVRIRPSPGAPVGLAPPDPPEVDWAVAHMMDLDTTFEAVVIGEADIAWVTWTLDDAFVAEFDLGEPSLLGDGRLQFYTTHPTVHGRDGYTVTASGPNGESMPYHVRLF